MWADLGARYAVTGTHPGSSASGGVLSVQVAVRWPVWFGTPNHTGRGETRLRAGGFGIRAHVRGLSGLPAR